MTNFREAVTVLSRAGVSFIVVGAYAGILQGAAQVTQDIDICYERSPENMKRLAAALEPYHPNLRGAPPGLPFILHERTLAQGINFTFQTDFGDIDLLGELSGVGQFPELARGRGLDRLAWDKSPSRISRCADSFKTRRGGGRKTCSRYQN